MRKIKFRAWFKVQKKMVYNLGFDNDSFKSIDESTDMPTVWDLDDVNEDGNCNATFNYELMQYTGLKDKNGKEIYEGDIVKFNGYVGKVIWDKFCWNVETFYNPFYDYPSLAFSENLECEVIGNIYENPELLEGTK